MNWNAVFTGVFGIAVVIAAGSIAHKKFGVTLFPKQSVPPPPAPFAALGPDCEIAPVHPDHEFLAASVYQGDTLVNVQLADADSTTTIVRVFVERGSKPITVLLKGHQPVIWDFEGDVSRVARAIVIAPSRDRAAVRGLPAANVDLLKLTRCPDRHDLAGDFAGSKVASTFQRFFGRTPDRAAHQYSANALSLPAVTFSQSPKDGPSRQTETKAEQDLLTYYRGGFRIVEPASLVTRAEVLTPETYPDMAGLIQLERAGAIRAPKPAEIDAFSDGLSAPYRTNISPDFRFRPSFSYVITRDIMLPAGLHGAHLKNFLVLANVPPPRGKVGHGCLAFMDGFRTSDDSPSCFGSSGANALRELAKLPAVAPNACRVMDVSGDAAIEAVSMYEPAGAKHSADSRRVAGPVDIRVSKPGAVVLVLNSYEPAVWRVSAAKGTRIAGVLLIGQYTSRIEGVALDVPMAAFDYESRGNRPKPSPECAPYWGYLATAHRGGPEAMLLDRQVTALIGRPLDVLRGDYKLAGADIR